MFFLEEQNLREELLDELANMKRENSIVKDSMNELKLLLSSQNNSIEASITEGESDVAIGNPVVNDNNCRGPPMGFRGMRDKAFFVCGIRDWL